MPLKSLLSKKLRTVFVLIGIALGLATLVALRATTLGLIDQFDRIATDYRGQIMVQAQGALDPLFSKLDFELADRLRGLPGVKDAYAVAHYLSRVPPPAGTAASKDLPYYFLAYALPAGSELLQRHKLVRGRYFEAGAREMILGDEAASALKLGLGDRYRLSGAEFRVVGIFHTAVRLLDGAGIYATHDFRQIFKNGKANVIALDLVAGPAGKAAVMAEIRARYPDLEPMESARAIDNFRHVAMFQGFSLGISIIAVTIAALGILNTMFTSVHERTREIGLLRALGWSSPMILTLILQEGLLLSLAGGLIGAVLGVAGTELLIRTVDIGLVRAHYPASLWLEAAALTVVTGLLSSLPPALKAIAIAPIEALRHE
jgi:putative ABC transport system permease protein